MSQLYTLQDLELPDDEPMVVIRSSFLWICDGDKYAAAALNMYVHWTRWLMKHRPVAQALNREMRRRGGKATQDTSLILYRKQAQLVDDLLHFCNEKRLRQANTFLTTNKKLLKIDDTPKSISDHVLKYELQIGVFKEQMAAWRKYREELGQDSDVDEVVEVALGDDLDGTDNSPLRNGQFTASERTIDGSLETDNSPLRNGQFTASNNRYNNNRSDRNNTNRESSSNDPQASSSPNGDTLSLIEEMRKRLDTLEQDNQSLRASNQTLQAELSTAREQISTRNTQGQTDEQTSTEANNETSYSQNATQPELPNIPVSSEKPKGRKPSRPKEEKPKVDVKRLQALLDSFIDQSREHFKQSDFTVELGSARSDNYKGALSIINIASTKGVRDVYQDFWDEPDKNDPDMHWWRDPKHLTFKAFCRGYATRIASIQFNADNKTQKKSSQPNSVSGYRNYTLNPVSETGETPVVTPQEHPGPAPRRLQIRRVADIQAALASHNHVATAVAQ